MLNSVYIALILCLVASNLNRILWVCRWLYRYLDSSQNDGLVPYFNQDGILIGMVRMRPDADLPHRTLADDSELEPELPTNGLTEATMTAPLVWDFWPNGDFQRLFSVEELADNSDLAVNWVLETVRTSGSPTALAWHKVPEQNLFDAATSSPGNKGRGASQTASVLLPHMRRGPDLSAMRNSTEYSAAYRLNLANKQKELDTWRQSGGSSEKRGDTGGSVTKLPPNCRHCGGNWR
ncbi:hypothetical protein C8R46DRAFT_1026760 [Mycena filopes]|nr:hypothetical protein C8R46DRAFT_1026760 [Mycena filopes]